jgi:hypothetical protein
MVKWKKGEEGEENWIERIKKLDSRRRQELAEEGPEEEDKKFPK